MLSESISSAAQVAVIAASGTAAAAQIVKQECAQVCVCWCGLFPRSFAKMPRQAVGTKLADELARLRVNLDRWGATSIRGDLLDAGERAGSGACQICIRVRRTSAPCFTS